MTSVRTLDRDAVSSQSCLSVSRASSPELLLSPSICIGPPSPHHHAGFSNGSTLSGSFDSFVPGHDLVGYYTYAPCSTYNSSQMTTANESISSTTGNGTLTPVVLTGLEAETLYCSQACVIDLDADPTKGDPAGPVCGAVQTFSWPTPVSE